MKNLPNHFQRQMYLPRDTGPKLNVHKTSISMMKKLHYIYLKELHKLQKLRT